MGEYNNLPAASENQTSYVTSDTLGTPRVVTKADGSVKSRHDYLPFGEEITGGLGGRNTVPQYAAADGVKQKFTGKFRDDEAGLDYFEARYYSSTQGRFTSPDSPFVDQRQTNPQSWNLYSYVQNNPCNKVDPNGRCSVPSGLKAGSVGICIEAFIAAPRIGGIGLGNDRGFSGNDPNLTAKVRVDLIITPNSDGKTYNIQERTQTGASTVVLEDTEHLHNNSVNAEPPRATITATAPGEASSKITNATTDQDGTTTFTSESTGRNGFQTAPLVGGLAPQGTIDINLNLVVTKDGRVGIAEGSESKDFPSYAAYSYRYKNGKLITTQLFRKPEGVPEDLTRRMSPIPKVDPR